MESNSFCIFYTDDDGDDRELFKQVVGGMKPSPAVYLQQDGDELMGMLENPPSCLRVIFLDLNMPRKNGLQVLLEIKRSERLRNYPVVVLTTSDDEKVIDITRELGANLFITKPVNFSVFKKAIAYAVSFNWTTQLPEHFVYNPN